MQNHIKTIIAAVLFLFGTIHTAVAADTLYFAGNIKISKKLSYKYNLRFIISDENKITGYSLSDPGGPNETKTKISGEFDSVNKVISYEEKAVLRSKVDMQKNDLCFVKASLKLKKSSLIETLSGQFVGTEPGKSSTCASGTIKMINTNKVAMVMKKMNELPRVGDDTTSNKNKTLKISTDKGKELLITGNAIKFTIWDNGKVDEDKISIMLNDKYILENYTLTTDVKIIEALLSANAVDTIKIIALNEGSIPPNTAAIKIETKTEEYPILVKAQMNEIRTIYLRKKTEH